MRPRDTQRHRLYVAEDKALAGKRVSKAATRHLVDTQHISHLYELGEDGRRHHMKAPTVAAVQGYVNAVTSAAWFRSRWGSRMIEVIAGQGSHNRWGTITVSPYHRRSEEAVLHEVAHALTPNDMAAHGPEFAGVLLTLVRYQMGSLSAKALRSAFRDAKVRSNLSAVPQPNPARVAAEDTRRDAAKEADRRALLTGSARREAAAVIRANVKAGRFGPSGTKPRQRALEVARTLEK